MPKQRFAQQPGTTLIELVVVVGIVAVLAAISFPRASRYMDRIHVSGATREVATVFATARMAAVARASLTSVLIDQNAGTIIAVTGRDTIVTRNIAQSFGVTMRATRDSMSYSSIGLGYGAANLRVILSRGEAADSVVTSRLGRIRY